MIFHSFLYVYQRVTKTTGACAPAPPADSPSRPKKIAHPAAPRRNKVGKKTLGLAIYIYDIWYMICDMWYAHYQIALQIDDMS